MKTSVETGDLWHIRHSIKNCFDGSEIVRLMERRQRRQLLQFGEYLGSDDGGTAKPLASVHHPVTNANQAAALIFRTKPTIDDIDGGVPVADRITRHFVGQFLTLSIFDC